VDFWYLICGLVGQKYEDWLKDKEDHEEDAEHD